MEGSHVVLKEATKKKFSRGIKITEEKKQKRSERCDMI